MFNSTGLININLANRQQILANTDEQAAVGVIVSDAIGVTDADGKKVAKAGTPISFDLGNRETSQAVLATASVPLVGVLLHDVDVTLGPNNGTALIFGFVNINRCEADVQTKIATAQTAAAASKLITFLRA